MRIGGQMDFRKLYYFVVFILLLLPLAGAQTTIVNGTLTDPSGNIWTGAQITASFQPTPNTPGPYIWTGGAFNTQPAPVFSDGSGSFTITLPSTSAISPSGSTWQFNVCPNATQACAIVQVPLSGGTVNLIPIITGAGAWPTGNIAATFISKFYNSSQVGPIPLNEGAIAFNTTTLQPEYWNGSIWQTFGTGGGGANPAAPAGSAQYSNANNSGFISFGEFTIDAFETGGGNNGQDNFINSASCVANGPCAAIISPTSTDSSGPGLFSLTKQSTIVTDLRANSVTTIAFNPGLNFASIFDGGPQALFSNQVDYNNPSISSTEGNTETLLSEEALFSGAGFSNGVSGCPAYCPNPPHTNVPQWAFHDVHTLFTSFNSSGINNVNTKQTGSLGTGDSQDEADFDIYSGGCVAPSDECHHWQSVHITTPGDYQGVVASSTDAGHFTVTTTAGTSTQGQGRFLIGLSPITGTDSTPLQNLPVGFIFKPSDLGGKFGEVVFQATNIPNSTFQGVTTTECDVPVQEGGVAQCTATVSVTSGRLCAVGAWNGSSCVGSTPVTTCLVFNSGNFFNFAEPIAVTAPSGGLQNLTVSVHRSVQIGSSVFQGGLCGTFLETNESQDIANVVGLLGYPLIGSVGGNTGVYINYDGSQTIQPIPNPGSSWGSKDTGNSQAAHGFSVLGLARHSNVVTGTNVTGFDSDKWKELGGAFDFNVTGCTSDTSLNSISVGAPVIYTGPDPSVGNPHAGEIAYAQTGADTVTPCNAVIATQFTAATIFPAAEIYDVLDHATGLIDGTFATSWQPAFTAPGTVVDSPTHYAAAVNGIQVSLEESQPLLDSTGYVAIAHGYSALVGASFQGQNFINNVIGSNGISNPLDLVEGLGIFNTGINLNTAPPNNGAAIRIGATSPLYANQSSSFRRYAVFQLGFGLNTAQTELLYDTDTTSYWFNYNFSEYPQIIFGPDLTNFAVQIGTIPYIPTQVGELRFAEFGSNGNTPFGPLFHIKQCAPLTPPSVTNICYSTYTPTNAVVTTNTPGSATYIYILQWNDVAGPAYSTPMELFNGPTTLGGGVTNTIPCSDMPVGTTGIIWNFQNSIGLQKVGDCTSPSINLVDNGVYSGVVGPNGTIAGSNFISGGFEATGLTGFYAFSNPDPYGTSFPALSITSSISQDSAGVLDVNTTSVGNKLGTVNAFAFFANGSQVCTPANGLCPGGGGGSGTVTSVAVGNLAPLFTATVSNPTLNASIAYTINALASFIGIANTTITTPAGSIPANTCTTPTSTTMTGVTGGNVFDATFTNNPNAVIGWGAVGGLVLTTWPSTNVLNWSVCNQTSSAVVAGSVNLNIGAR